MKSNLKKKQHPSFSVLVNNWWNNKWRLKSTKKHHYSEVWSQEGHTESVTAWINRKKQGWFGVCQNFLLLWLTRESLNLLTQDSTETFFHFCHMVVILRSQSQTSRGKNMKNTILPVCSYPQHQWLQLYEQQGVSGHGGLFLILGVKIHTSHNTVHGPGLARRCADLYMQHCMCICD